MKLNIELNPVFTRETGTTVYCRRLDIRGTKEISTTFARETKRLAQNKSDFQGHTKSANMQR